MKNNFDEEFLVQFAALSASGEENAAPIVIPNQVVGDRKWNLCILARVMVDRVMHENSFRLAMATTWNPHPETQIEALGNNYFLVEFVDEQELLKTLQKTTWNFRGYTILVRPSHGTSDLIEPVIDIIEYFVQIHGLPPGTMTVDGISILMAVLGTPITEVQTCFVAGRKVYKQKVHVDLNKPLKDKLPIQHPFIRMYEVYVVYEGVTRICRFCTHIGHEHTHCAMRTRVACLAVDEKYKDRPDLQNIPLTNFGKWICDSTQVLETEMYELQPNQTLQRMIILDQTN